MNLLWIEDFPLFLPKEDGSGGEWVSMVWVFKWCDTQTDVMSVTSSSLSCSVWGGGRMGVSEWPLQLKCPPPRLPVRLFTQSKDPVLAGICECPTYLFIYLFNNPYDSKVQCTVKYKHGLKHQGAHTYRCSNTQSVLISTNIITNQC